MKVVILAGGLGTRLSEETHAKPKPMVEIAGKPILWHIMKFYSAFGFNHFVICLGYKSQLIKKYFLDYYLLHSDLHIEMKTNENCSLRYHGEPWVIDLIETQPDSQTGGRLLQVKSYVGQDSFFVSYGDGLSNINLPALLNLYKKYNCVGAMTVVQRAQRFGVVELADDKVKRFEEKPSRWINAGYYIFNQEIFSYIEDKYTVLEEKPLKKLTEMQQIVAYKHDGFWQPMDTLREKNELEQMWKNQEAPWKIWHE